MRRLASLLPLLVAVALPPSGAAQQAGFAASPDVAIRVFNLVGRTRIVAWARDSVDVTASIEPGGGRLYAGGDRHARKIAIEGGTGAAGATLVVRLPGGARVWVKSASAPIEIEGVRGEVEASTVTGAVRLAADPRVATLESIDGDVEARGAATVLRVRTGAGTVRVAGARGDLSVVTVGGAIEVEAGELLSARLETVSGPVEISSQVAVGGRLDVQTHDGDVTIRLSWPINARFELESVGGAVTTRFGAGPERSHPKGRAAFSVGAGQGAARGGLVTARSFKGTIRVDSNPKG